jgi:hypothetical protein
VTGSSSSSAERITVPAAVGPLQIRQVIRDLVVASMRGADRLDAELLSSCFWPDATVQYGGLPAWTREEFADAWLRAARACTGTQHLLFNDTIEIDGDRALVETYLIAVFVPAAAADESALLPFCGAVGGGRVGFQGGRCVDRLECRRGEWRIAARTVCGDWFATGDATETESQRRWIAGIGRTATPMRSRDDPSYRGAAGAAARTLGSPGDLLTREAIRDLVYRFARGMDRADVDLLGGVFADAEAERALLDELATHRDTWPLHNHYVTNLRIDVAQGTGVAECCFAVAFVDDTTRPRSVHLLGGRYLFDLAEDEDGWRIGGRTAVLEWQARGDGRHIDAFHRATGDKSRRSREDASYQPEVTVATSRTIDELVEREGVRDALARYARGADRLDRELLESAFVDVQPQFVDYMFRQADTRPIQDHCWTNLRVQLEDDDLAFVEASYISVHGYVDGATTGFIDGPTSAQDINLVAGRYVRWFEKAEGRWGLRNLSTAAVYPPPSGGLGDWHAVLDGSGLTAFLAATGNLRRRGGRDDPSYGSL